MDQPKEQPKFGALRCNFCGVFHNECRMMIAGPNVMICDTCISLCVDIIREKYPDFKRDINEHSNPKP